MGDDLDCTLRRLDDVPAPKMRTLARSRSGSAHKPGYTT
jgi:hypothetical protein